MPKAYVLIWKKPQQYFLFMDILSDKDSDSSASALPGPETGEDPDDPEVVASELQDEGQSHQKAILGGAR